MSFHTSQDFNPRSPRGGATRSTAQTQPQAAISIHAPHEGERLYDGQRVCVLHLISIHAPHEGERPARYSPRPSAHRYFNPRSPRGGATRGCIDVLDVLREFQSTLPTRGSDDGVRQGEAALVIFQSTLPTRGSDLVEDDELVTAGGISIHAPHEGERPLRSR